MEFSVRIAKKKILINSVNSSIYNLCKGYLVEDSNHPDIIVRVNDEMLEMEFERARQIDENVYSPKSIEGRVLHRMIAESLLDYDVFLMHGAVIAVGNTSYMFTGKSGIGKTTHIKKWLTNLEGAFVVNGDKPLIIVEEKGACACGTPWCGKENLGTNAVVPLRSIVFMERGSKNHIEKISFKAALPALLEQVYQPQDADRMRKTLKLLSIFKNQVSFYKFSFDNFQEDAFQVSYDALVKDNKEQIM